MADCIEKFERKNYNVACRYCSESGLRSLEGEIGILAAINKWISSPIDSINTRYKYYSRLLRCLRIEEQSMELLSLHSKVQVENLVRRTRLVEI